MIAKKNVRLDLERKRVVFFNIGLLAASSFVLAAFSYETPLDKEILLHEKAQTELSYLVQEKEPIIKPKNDVVKPQPQKQAAAIGSKNAISQHTKSTASTSTETDPNVGLTGPSGKFFIPKVAAKVGGEMNFDPFPAIDAEYIGGIVAMKTFIGETMEYPQESIEMNEQGRVFVTFIVTDDGSVSDVKISRGVSRAIDKEARRIVKSFPKWKPAENAYGKVSTRISLPLNFILTN